jgi:hypothetical protein
MADKPISLRETRASSSRPLPETESRPPSREDVERLMTRKEREGGKIPLPGPLPKIKLKPKGQQQGHRAGL